MRLQLHHHRGECIEHPELGPPLRAALAAVYLDAFSEPPYETDAEKAHGWAEGALRTHAICPGFALVTVQRHSRGTPHHDDRRHRSGQGHDEPGDVLGFAYGVLGADDQWFTRTLRSVLTAAQAQRWLGRHGELVELALLRSARGLGLGGQLHDAVLARLRQQGASTAILTTDKRTPAAQGLYTSRGWSTVATLGPAQLFMALDLGDRPTLHRPVGAQEGRASRADPAP